MEARFIILHPDDPGEILSATALIRCLKSQVEGALVYSVVKDEFRWLLNDNPHLEEIFVFQENPKELVDELKDFLPDYLIDLDGSRGVRRFKNRLKVLDFTIKRGKSDTLWMERALETCKLFDVTDDGKGPELIAGDAYRKILPGTFLDGYLVLALDSSPKARPIADDQIIELVVMTEKPMVITGNTGDRNLADRISQSTGCAVFPTCGDLTKNEIVSVINQAKGLLVFDQVWSLIADASGANCRIIRENTDLAGLKVLALWARAQFDDQP